MTDDKPAARRTKSKHRGRSSSRDDSALIITDDNGTTLFQASAKVASSVRYLLARLQLNDADGLPQRLAPW